MRLIAILSLLLLGSMASAENSITQSLREFHENPKKFMDQLPPEVIDGVVIPRSSINYADRLHRSEKMKARQKIILKSQQPFRPRMIIGEKDQAELLVDGGILIRNITELNRRGLMQAELSETPWADSYWPMAKGLIAIRYADPTFPNSKIWINNYSHYLSYPTFGILNSGSTSAINRLSPAEKYDLLVGDGQLTLTNYSWNLGKKYYDKHGVVATWMGICHGWSAAAHMLAPVPQKSVTLRTPQGTPITFYQSDVKALVSMLWANSSPATRFVGSRCKTSRPPKDQHGRNLDPTCLDTNPGTFHLALTNQLGINNRSFVMDSTYDAQVWNFAVANYKATYFNPQTLVPTPELSQAVIPMERFTIDKFKPYRAHGARYVVGVVMDVSHVNAVNPSTGIMTKFPLKTLRFLYDLELDESYNIIGGEWYMNAHPDFLWTFDANAKAISRGDLQIDRNEWRPGQPMPASWTEAARKSSSAGSPLAAVIDKIVESAPGREVADSGGAIENNPTE